jgi:hypothetical protein
LLQGYPAAKTARSREQMPMPQDISDLRLKQDTLKTDLSDLRREFSAFSHKTSNDLALILRLLSRDRMQRESTAQKGIS